MKVFIRNALFGFLFVGLVSSNENFSCETQGEERVTTCVADIVAAANSASSWDPQLCRRVKLSVKCIEDIENRCNDAIMETPHLDAAAMELPLLNDIVNTNCGEFDPCELGAELIEECVDIAIDATTSGETSRTALCRNVNNQLTCIENVIFLCPDVDPIHRIMTMARRAKYVRLCE